MPLASSSFAQATLLPANPERPSSAVTIDTGAAASAEEGERLAEAQRLARGLGAAIASGPDIDAAAGLLKYAGDHGASAIVAGMGRKRIFGKSVVERLRLNSRDFSVVAVAGPRSDGGAKGSRRLAGYFEESAGQFAAAVIVIAAVTGLNLALAAYAGYWAAAITYLAAISISALFLDRWPVFLAALLSAVAWDFLFIPPRYTCSYRGPRTSSCSSSISSSPSARAG